MFSYKENPTTAPASATALFSAYASVAASIMLVRSLASEIVPTELRHYLSAAVTRLFAPLSHDLTMVVEEYSGMYRNEIFDAAELYLRTKIPATAYRLHIAKLPWQRTVDVAAAGHEKIPDEFEDIRVTWQLICTGQDNNNSHNGDDMKYFEVTFDKKFKNRVLDSYFPYVLSRAESIKIEERVIKLHGRDCPHNDDETGVWGSINLEHPATFDTLAMDPEVKRSIVDDLDRFLRRREFYKKVGKAWKRGYLLYGPPGTGKSSLIAAMANYLKFDVYEVELTSIYSNSDLRSSLLATSNRSILVIEDIDCSLDLQNRITDYDQLEILGGLDPGNTKLTLSGLLNFIDGLWSSCGDERIIVFTTNHKDRVDPALLRPGRMDVHINMSYCTKYGFRILAANYLGIQGNEHHLGEEIEGLIGETEVTPAAVAEELMQSDDADVALKGLADFLKRKRAASNEIEESVEPPNLKRTKMSSSRVLGVRW